jgi:hypothetical protein
MIRVLLLSLLAMVAFAVERRPGSVTFSDGNAWQGDIALASGAKLQMHDGNAVRILDPALVSEIRFVPEKESMERAFAMPEPGKPIRVETGEAYALRYLRVQVLLRSGERIDGHLYATGITIDVAGADGAEPERLDQLLYVTKVAFSTGEGDVAQRLTVHGGAGELGAAAIDGLVPLDVTGTDGVYTVGAPLGSAVQWAALREHVAVVGWPADDVELTKRIAAQLPNLDDFFDRKEVLATRQSGDDVLSLMRLTRTAHTTDGPNKPWHIEVWRWRLDGERSLIAGRVCLLRGRSGTPPEVRTTPAWCDVKPVDGVLTLEGWP